MLFLYIICSQSQKMYVTAKQKPDDVSALLSALSLQLNLYYFDALNYSRTISQPISVWNKTVFKPDLCLMMSNSRSQYYARYRWRLIAEYSEEVWAYREINCEEINARQKNARRRNVELSRLHNENEYLGEKL